MAEYGKLGLRNPWIWIITIILIVLISWAIGVGYNGRSGETGFVTASTAVHNSYKANNNSLYRTPEDTGGMLR